MVFEEVLMPQLFKDSFEVCYLSRKYKIQVSLKPIFKINKRLERMSSIKEEV